MEAENQELKVSDLVNFKKEDYTLARELIKTLDGIVDTYSTEVGMNPKELDTVRREFVANMSTFATIYAKIKAFKGSNHTYLEDARKGFKSDVIRRMIDVDGTRVTEAKETVYADEEYKKYVAFTEKTKQFFIKVEEKYDFYNGVLQFMQQTISVVSKEYEQAKNS